MVKELYQEITREVTLNVTVGRVDSVRRKNITKSGCRVYRDGCVGVAGCLGQPTEETWAAAERALERKVTSPGPETGKQRRQDLRESSMSPEEFLAETERLLAALREEFPDFVLSNKVMMTEGEVRLQNDAGLDYTALDRVYALSLVVKQVGSPNVFDSFLGQEGRSFDYDRWLDESRQVLLAHRSLMDMPEGKDLLFLTDASGGNGLAGMGVLHKALNGQQYLMGASLFRGRLGEKIFDSRVSLISDRSGTDGGFEWFFDSEGVTLEGDRVALVENGVLRDLMTDKKYAALLGRTSTGCAGGAYDDAPSLAGCRFRVAPTGQTVAELTRDEDGVLLMMASGGDWTDEGNFATPVQCAYVCRNGRLVGRLPEFNMTVKLDELFGSRFVGASTDRYFGERALAFRGTVL